ncbi:hypothetical protein GCM10009566_50290 [Streptomyces murinus]|uniref:hypothetical protein n=1 Tax=Streptomyces murinus TaxID=33900 RepID=UPI001601198B|nr:hypothetical protein [Streptomyces murinus]
MKLAFGALLRRLPRLRLAAPAEQVPTAGEDKVFYGGALAPGRPVADTVGHRRRECCPFRRSPRAVSASGA